MDKEVFGKFICYARKKAGLTQREVAEQLHVTDKAVSKWERGLNYPDITILEPLAACLNVPVERLITCDGSDENNCKKLLDNTLTISKEVLKKSKVKSFLYGTILPIVTLMLGAFLIISGFQKSIEYSALYFEDARGIVSQLDTGYVSTSFSEHTKGAEGQSIVVNEFVLCGCADVGNPLEIDSQAIIHISADNRKGKLKFLLLNSENSAIYFKKVSKAEAQITVSPGTYQAIMVGYWYSGKLTVEIKPNKSFNSHKA